MTPRHALLWLVSSALMLAPAAAAAAAAERVGEVIFVQSVATAQQPGAAPRFLEKGTALQEGDVISTAAKGFAVIGFRDGTKMTLRPNTTFAIDKLRHDAGEESGVFRLLKGGVRALTGLIGKRNPQGMEVNTSTAMIGIRGTSFDARLCDEDCVREDASATRKAGQTSPESIVARVAVVSGSAVAVGSGTGAEARVLTRGSPLFNGDTIRTQKASYAVLAFRDQSKITVIADSELKLENVRLPMANVEGGSFGVRVIRGGMRALTGLLAKSNPKAVSFSTQTATIGIRGTGLDILYTQFCFTPQDCVTLATIAHIWQGPPIDLNVDGQQLVIDADQTGVHSPDRKFLALVIFRPVLTEPRPDQVDVDFDNLFGTEDIKVTLGLVVGMRDGHILFCAIGGDCIDLGPDEAGWLPPARNRPIRLTPYPNFLRNDEFPYPEIFDERSFRVLERLNPGALICEIR